MIMLRPVLQVKEAVTLNFCSRPWSFQISKTKTNLVSTKIITNTPSHWTQYDIALGNHELWALWVALISKNYCRFLAREKTGSEYFDTFKFILNLMQKNNIFTCCCCWYWTTAPEEFWAMGTAWSASPEVTICMVPGMATVWGACW